MKFRSQKKKRKFSNNTLVELQKQVTIMSRRRRRMVTGWRCADQKNRTHYTTCLDWSVRIENVLKCVWVPGIATIRRRFVTNVWNYLFLGPKKIFSGPSMPEWINTWCVQPLNIWQMENHVQLNLNFNAVIFRRYSLD